MIVRSLKDIVGTEREVDWGNGSSRRFLLAKDGMGYTLTDTIVKSHTRSFLEYKNHLEACYCISGKGRVVDIKADKSYPIEPGTMYALDQNDAHYLIAETKEMHLLCVFRPALEGHECHNLQLEESSAY